MKKSVLTFVAFVIVIAIAVVFNSKKSSFSEAGFPKSKSLKELNDTTKTNVVAFAQENYNSEDGNLFQLMAIVNLEYQYNNGLYAGYNGIGTASTQFGVMCPTNVFIAGYNFGTSRVEARVGDFTRNSVTTSGFDPQFSNACILAGESAPVSNAMQISFISNGTKVYAGHQNGSKFYSFSDGNYYAGAEQKIGNITIAGGMDFAENLTGYADVKWMCHNDIITLTCNKLGSEQENFVLSYVHNNIPLFKGARMNLGSALWKQSEKSGLQLVAGLQTGRVTLFAQTGGYVLSKTFTPSVGLGMNYNL